MTEYEITTHPDGKQFIRIEDKWMPVEEIIRRSQIAVINKLIDGLPQVSGLRDIHELATNPPLS